MQAYWIEWLNLLGRWVHMITGIAWIGASFYFVWLDNHLQTPVNADDVERGVGGEIWSVHGGGFYHAQKYQVAPPVLPATLHWFKWEAYTTWLSGIFLMALVYWYGAELYLIDPAVAELSKPAAVMLGIGVLVVGWLVYDALCRSSFGANDLVLSAVLFGLLVLTAWGLCQIFSGRGAYIHYGAMLGTIMVANVFFVIIPGQKDLVAAKKEGRSPDPIHGIRGKQRSVHNTYFTLPVLFVMISNHYAFTYGHPYNWIILIVISLAGAVIRVYFVARHKGRASPVLLIFPALLLLVMIFLLRPPAISSERAQAPIDRAGQFQAVQSIVLERCSGCHAQTPTMAGFAAAPKGVLLDTPERIRSQALVIHQQSVVTRVMPIGNLTKMLDNERVVIADWFNTLTIGKE